MVPHGERYTAVKSQDHKLPLSNMENKRIPIPCRLYRQQAAKINVYKWVDWQSDGNIYV